MSRATGAALGVQVAAAVIMGAGVVPPGIPAERGFTGAFVLGLVAALVALAATSAIPARRGDPLRQDAQVERRVRRILIRPASRCRGGAVSSGRP